ncbi:hypothetical protein, partial [Paenarthrobacter aromaticivorans]
NQLKTRPPHTGVRNGPAIISTNQKTIGINKLGTLLSSQTTDTPGTNQNPKGLRIAPEQLFKLTRFDRMKQIALGPPKPVQRHTKHHRKPVI